MLQMLASLMQQQCNHDSVAQAQNQGVTSELKSAMAEVSRQSEEMQLLRQELAKAKQGAPPAASPSAARDQSPAVSPGIPDCTTGRLHGQLLCWQACDCRQLA